MELTVRGAGLLAESIRGRGRLGGAGETGKRGHAAATQHTSGVAVQTRLGTALEGDYSHDRQTDRQKKSCITPSFRPMGRKKKKN